MRISRRLVAFEITIIVAAIVFTGSKGYECGTYQAFTELIVGGKPVLDPTNWPWIVGLFHRNEKSTTFQCGATLVSRHVVVTAAHCVRSFGYTLDAKDILLVMGRTRVQDWREQRTVQIRNAQAVVVHPTYVLSRRSGIDLAFIELDFPIDITENVSPICLWEGESDQKLTANNGMVVGWGRDENNNLVTETARKSKLPIVDKQVCLDSNPNFQSFAKNFTYCAGNRDGTGPCNGDSGSGMYVLRTMPNGFKSWVLRGIVSRTLRIDDDSKTCDLRNFIVFTDMAKLKPWLTETSCSFNNPQTFGALNMKRLGDKYYYFELDRDKFLNWTSAQQFCQSHGLQLASVETKNENNLIAEYVWGKIPANTWGYIWLGGTDSQREGRWRWKNGQKLKFTDWGRGQPSHYREDYDCLMMRVWSDGTHEWLDFPCLDQTRFVCELEDVCS